MYGCLLLLSAASEKNEAASVATIVVADDVLHNKAEAKTSQRRVSANLEEER